MIAKARSRYVRMSPRKVRYVLDQIRQKPVLLAYSILDRTTRRATTVVRNLIRQAADAAVKQKKVPLEELYISRTFADGAGMFKRFRAMSMGRAGQIRKRLSHVTVELDRYPTPHARVDRPRRVLSASAAPGSKPVPSGKTQSTKKKTAGAAA